MAADARNKMVVCHLDSFLTNNRNTNRFIDKMADCHLDYLFACNKLSRFVGLLFEVFLDICDKQVQTCFVS